MSKKKATTIQAKSLNKTQIKNLIRVLTEDRQYLKGWIAKSETEYKKAAKYHRARPVNLSAITEAKNHLDNIARELKSYRRALSR